MHRLLIAVVAAGLLLHGAALAASGSWDGTYTGKWGGQADLKIVIANDKVVSYDFMGKPQEQLGETVIKDDTLSFGMPPYWVVTLTRGKDGRISAHYHQESNADAELAVE
jgi:hypothetical protein